MRLPYFHVPVRGNDVEAGGVADLQTDVMRFMAILAICLVAIFALVQSIPLTPVRSVVAEPKPKPEPAPESVVEPEPAPLPEPARLVPEPAAEPVPLPEPQPVVPTPVVEPPTPTPSTQAQKGFSLQFESDLALTRLVARNEVGLYAIGPDKSLRMTVNRGRFSFWPASTPNQFHEMDPGTVPAEVQRALRLSQGEATGSLEWGVTLPAGMQQQLNGLLETAESGSIFIAANGQLRLER